MSSSSPAPWERFKELFALDHQAIEVEVEDLPGNYKDLDPRALYTTIEDLYTILSSPHVQGTWVDLGAGTGGPVLLYASLFPDRKAIGVERSSSRIEAGEEIRKQFNITNARFLQGDLFSCDVPDGETYFLYFPTGHVLDRVLSELRKKRTMKALIVIESHGDLLPRLRKEHWLKALAEIPLSSSRHYPNAVVFERCEAPVILGPHQLSFLEKYLLIQDPSGIEWIGDTMGLEWLREEEYQLAHPPRTIEWKQVKKVLDLNEISSQVKFLLKLRRQGPLELELACKRVQGFIRKISVGDRFEVEISSGEWVKWEDIRTIRQDNILCYDSSLA